MASYVSRVKVDVERWVSGGLIDGATGAKLVRDIEARAPDGVSFGTILATFAAVLFSAAILLFVAAHWELIPRLARVIGIFGLIAAGYLSGAILKTRGHSALGEGAWLAGAAAFGAGIALIGQMYHLSGRETDALLAWTLGTAVAAALLGSRGLTNAAACLAAVWLVLAGIDWDGEPFPYMFPLVAAGIWLVSLRSQSRPARDLLMLSLLSYVLLLAFEHSIFWVSLALTLVSAGFFLAAVRYPARIEAVLKLGGNAPVHAMLGVLAGLALLQGDLAEESAFALAAAAAFAAIAAALFMAGREHRGVRRLSYLGFALEVAFVYAITVGTMLDTAGFFLASALLLGVLAVVILRLERRLNTAVAATGGISG